MGNAAYDKANTKPMMLKFNLKTDADILDHFKKQINVQGYIKALVRADIAAHQAEKKEEES